MAITTPNMGLKRWDQPNDLFSYVELSDSLALIDAHDHSSGKGVQIPTAGIANLAVDATKLADNSVTNLKVPAASITGDRLVNLTVPDSKLASSNNATYRTIFQATGLSQAAMSAVMFSPAANGTMYQSGASGTTTPVIFPFAAASYTVPGKTTKLRVIAVIGTNSIAPTVGLITGLAPVTAVAGAASAFTSTISTTWVTGSNTTLAAPAASTRFTVTGADFTVPADGYYALGAMPAAGGMTPTSLQSYSLFLQVRYV